MRNVTTETLLRLCIPLGVILKKTFEMKCLGHHVGFKAVVQSVLG